MSYNVKEKLNDYTKDIVKKYRRIAVLMPFYKTMATKCVADFTVFVSRLYQFGFNPSFFFLDQTNVVMARNELAGYCYENHKGEVGPFDIVLWLDSDQTWGFNDFLNLLHRYDNNQEIKILSGRYITRDIHKPKVCAFNNRHAGDLSEEPIYKNISPDSAGLQEVDGVGFGFVMMSPQVIVDMYDTHAKHQFAFRQVGPKELGGNMGEDLDWCNKAQKLGYKIYLDNDVMIGHHGLIAENSFMMWKRNVDNARVGQDK